MLFGGGQIFAPCFKSPSTISVFLRAAAQWMPERWYYKTVEIGKKSEFLSTHMLLLERRLNQREIVTAITEKELRKEGQKSMMM
jgi:hypothetical protein